MMGFSSILNLRSWAKIRFEPNLHTNHNTLLFLEHVHQSLDKFMPLKSLVSQCLYSCLYIYLLESKSYGIQWGFSFKWTWRRQGQQADIIISVPQSSQCLLGKSTLVLSFMGVTPKLVCRLSAQSYACVYSQVTDSSADFRWASSLVNIHKTVVIFSAPIRFMSKEMCLALGCKQHVLF